MNLRVLYGLTLVAMLGVLATGARSQEAEPPKFLNPEYADAVHSLRDCLDVLPRRERRLAILRSGIGSVEPLSGEEVAARLGLDARTISTSQWAVVRQMKRAAADGACRRDPSPRAPARDEPATSTSASADSSSRPLGAAAVGAPEAAPGWDDPTVLALLGVSLLCLLGILREIIKVARA